MRDAHVLHRRLPCSNLCWHTSTCCALEGMDIVQLIHPTEVTIKTEELYVMEELSLDRRYWAKGEHTTGLVSLAFRGRVLAAEEAGGEAEGDGDAGPSWPSAPGEGAAEDRGPGNAAPVIPAGGRCGRLCVSTPPS